MSDKDLIYLIEKYLEGNCTAAEKQEVELWFEEYVAGDREYYDDDESQIKQAAERSLAMIQQKTKRNALRLMMVRRLAAAVVFVVLSACAYLYFSAPANIQQVLTVVQQKSYDVTPGGNKAILTLASGEQIQLSDAKDGVVIGAAQLSYSDGTSIHSPSEGGPTAARRLTVSTPRGGTYQVVLSDGTKVWLNAESEMSFPSAFSGQNRVVELAGEGYFEVAQNKAMPFKVKMAHGTEVRVTGTHFNVMAYENENHLSATLLEGGVQLIKDSKIVSLKPGQQAVLQKQTGVISKSEADMEEGVAWKNGFFFFNNENIHSIMRKVSRWYSVDVVYEGNMEGKDFSGTVSRYKNVSEVLKMLELTGIIHFKVKGRRISVMP
jgi:ferric-dicitrate binding protein FerR (iron transport regulator)